MSEAGTIAWSSMCGVMAFVLFVAAIVLFIKAVEDGESYDRETKNRAKYWVFGGVGAVLSAVGFVGGAMYLGALY